MFWGILEDKSLLVIIGLSFTWLLTSIYLHLSKKWKRKHAQNSLNLFKQLRTLSIQKRRSDLGIENTAGYKVFGVVMDWFVSPSRVTLASYISGDCGMYYSTGGGNLVSGGGDKLTTAIQELNKIGELFLAVAKSETASELPPYEIIRFYLLSNSEMYCVEDDAEKIMSNNSSLSILFYAAQNVISELRRNA
jgi:hypothetical protein